MSEGDWHVSGVVGQTSGFGLFFDCQLLDASRFAGIAFRVQGEIEGGAELTFFIGSAENEVSRAWRLQNGDAAAAPSFGRCTPAATEFDGSCRAARVELPVTPLRRQAAATQPCDLLPGTMPMTIFAGDGFHLRVRDGDDDIRSTDPDYVPVGVDVGGTLVPDSVTVRAGARSFRLRRSNGIPE